MTITAAQRTRLQTLYSQWEKYSLDCPGGSREQRIAWASQQVRRELASFSDLTLDEAKPLIDVLQNAVGHKHPAKPRPRRAHARDTTRASRQQGTEGRHDQAHPETTMAGPAEIERIQRDLTDLGWSQQRLEAFLQSSRGPLKGRTAIRTLGDANEVHWALKRMAARIAKGKDRAIAS